ncbi:hypothetical protein [Kytococcus sedentarius]|uniref:hypothetical protein n=1 Tax=Kytococcus sedentarius TaxID=1276 RepID=UPI001EF39E42|nr:hypothetical protein [Kytococcus sedentarius]
MTAATPSQPPVAARRLITREHHGRVFTDSWEWLRDTEDPEVVAHLEAENAWTDVQLAPQESLRERMLSEIKARTQQTDVSVPARHGQWWYYTRTVEGQQYPIHARVAATGEYAADRPPGATVGAASGPPSSCDDGALARGRQAVHAAAVGQVAPHHPSVAGGQAP